MISKISEINSLNLFFIKFLAYSISLGTASDILSYFSANKVGIIPNDSILMSVIINGF